MLPKRNPVLLLIFSFLLVSAVGVVLCDRQLAEGLLPMYRKFMDMFMPDAWRIVSLKVVQEGREAFISARVETVFPIVFAGITIPAGIGMTGSTLLGNVVVPPLIMFTLLLSWVAMVPDRRLGPTLVVFPVLILVMGMDIPLILVGSLWDILHANFTPYASQPWQAKAMNLLNGGGRQALSVAGGLFAINLGTRLQTLCSLSPPIAKKFIATVCAVTEVGQSPVIAVSTRKDQQNNNDQGRSKSRRAVTT